MIEFLGPEEIFEDLLNSFKDAIVFVDTSHTIFFMNSAAKQQYKKGEALVGTSIFDCHNKVSNEKIFEIFEKMEKNGITEECITDEKNKRIYMRAVRRQDGTLLGYYERYVYLD